MSGAHMTPYDIEGLFIEKLTQKYKLNERDIKRAFSQYDKDGNGLLDLNELVGAFERYLNGVDRNSIKALIDRYDVNGDGQISFEEFYELLVRRDASKAPHPRSDPRSKHSSLLKREQAGEPEEACYSRPQHGRRGQPSHARRNRDEPDIVSTNVPEYNDDHCDSRRRPLGQRGGRERDAAVERASFGQRPPARDQPRHHRRSTQPRDDNGEYGVTYGGRTAGRRDPDQPSWGGVDRCGMGQTSQQRIGRSERKGAVYGDHDRYQVRDQPYHSSTDDYSEVSNISDVSDALSDVSEYSVHSNQSSEISSEFDPNDADDMESRVKVFMQNLKSYLIREALQLRKEERVANSIHMHTQQLSEGVGRDIMLRAFGRHTQSVGRDSVNFRSFCKVLKSFHLPGLPDVRMEVYQYLFSLCTSDVEPNLADPIVFVDLLFGGSDPATRNVSEQIFRRRASVGHGPVLDKTAGQALPNEVSLSDVKEKYVCSKSRTTYMTPTNFTVENLQTSASPPSCEITRSHVFGLRVAELYSGKGLHCLRAHEGDKAQRYLVYAASSLGVVHDIASNTQKFFDGHSDEITCISVDPTSTFVVTGQLGRDPALYIWEARTTSFVKRIGKGFFQRAVCAACFSYDTKYVCAIGCDDRHSLGIWDVNSDQLVCEQTAANGIPPQVRSLTWAPGAQLGATICSQHHGLGDVFVTTGERHLKFWSFQRPETGSSNGLLAFKGGIMGNRKPALKNAKQATASKGTTVDQAKIYHCSEFIERQVPRDRPTARGNDYNVITGGDNGYLYQWESCVCVGTVRASRGAIRSIKVAGDKILAGCMEGVVKLYDSSLQLLGEFSVLLDDNISDTPRQQNPRARIMDSGRGNRPVVRPKSANRAVRGGGVATAVQAVARMSVKAKDDTSRAKSASLARLGGAAAARDHTQAKMNAVLAMDMDYKPFFYSAPGGGESGETLVVSCANGYCVRLHIASRAMEPPTRLFSFHTGELWGLSNTGSLGNIFVTCGDDRWLCVWSLESKDLMCRQRLEAAAKCCHFDKNNEFIAVGMARGFFSIHFFVNGGTDMRSSITDALVSRHDVVEDISDIRFNPASTQLAVGSHDNYIDIYDVELRRSGRSMKASARAHPVKKLKGHTSYITHLDWSKDGRIIQSTCGAYEILYWDVETGRQFSYTTGWNPSDVKWKTYTCILGFPVMGIWPLYADGTDINSLHVSRDHSLVATADDSGMLNVFNYPCVVKNAPRKSFNGHSSHVTNVRFLSDDRVIVTVGGNDKCAICWSVDKVKLGKPAPPEQIWR